jgi:hypothetical protein
MLTPSIRLYLLSIVLLSIPFGPDLAMACSNCFAASGVNGLRAYLLSTAILTSMPFILIGAIIFYCYKSRPRVSSEVRPTQMAVHDRPCD